MLEIKYVSRIHRAWWRRIAAHEQVARGCVIQAITPVADPFRLEFPGDTAVLDLETGLVWLRSSGDTSLPPDGKVDSANWNEARMFCLQNSFAVAQGWRLPSIVELRSLKDPFTSDPVLLPDGHPFINVLDADYWSATTDADDLDKAWMVRFFGFGPITSSKTSSAFVWCVRGGHNDGSQY